MRVTELLLSVLAFCLIVALRGIIPIDLPSQQVYLGIVAILAFIGWAGVARVIRGLVLHFERTSSSQLPKRWDSVALVSSSVTSFPTRCLLSSLRRLSLFPGTFSEKSSSLSLAWVFRNLLPRGVTCWNQARSIRALTAFPWLLYVPGLAIFATVMAFNFLGDGLRDALDPRRVTGGKIMSSPLLQVDNLQTHFFTDDAVVRAVDGVTSVSRKAEPWPWSENPDAARVLSLLCRSSDCCPQPPGRVVGGAGFSFAVRTCCATPKRKCEPFAANRSP